MIYPILLVLAGLIIGWFVLKPNQDAVSKWKQLEPGTKLTNRRGTNYEINERGGITRTGTIGEFVDHPNVQRQLKGFNRMFMQQTILALWQGKIPPHSVGGYGTLTKKKLIVEWNDEWQTEMNTLSESFDITYNILFDIPDEHPDAGIVYTSDEIAEQYGREEENS